MERFETIFAGKINWSRSLIAKIKKSMNIFQSNEECIKSHEIVNVIKTYNILINSLVKFEVLHYQYWIKSFDEIFDCLNAPVLLKTNNSQHFYVNFDQILLNVVRESQLMVKLGLSVPESCQKLLLDEKRLKLTSKTLQVSCFSISNSTKLSSIYFKSFYWTSMKI